MKVTIFGASGRVGQATVAAALAAGHEVTAFVHNSNPFADTNGVTVIKGNVSDVQAIARAITGADAVISALGSWHTKSRDILTQAMQNLIPALETQGCRRLISLTGSAAFWQGDSPTALNKLTRLSLHIVAPAILRDGERHLQLLAASQLEWTCIRSPAMTAKEDVSYHLERKISGPFATVPRVAVAQSLVDQLGNTSYLQQAPVIYRHP